MIETPTGNYPLDTACVRSVVLEHTRLVRFDEKWIFGWQRCIELKL